MEDNLIFYVYAYLDPRKPGKYEYKNFCFLYEPYYIGKGSGDRITKNMRTCLKGFDLSNTYKTRKIVKIQNSYYNPEQYSFIVKNNLSESNAHLLEIELISLIGRSNTNSGPLTNLTDGGDGWTGAISPLKGKTYEEIYGEETAKKLKLIRKENCSLNTPELIERGKVRGLSNRGKKLEDLFGEEKAKEIKLNMSKASKGKPKGPSKLKGKTYEEILGEERALELKNKRSISRKGNTLEKIYGKEEADRRKEKWSITHSTITYIFTNPSGEEFITNRFKKFCEENSISYYSMCDVIKGRHKNMRGWSVRKMEENLG